MSTFNLSAGWTADLKCYISFMFMPSNYSELETSPLSMGLSEALG